MTAHRLIIAMLVILSLYMGMIPAHADETLPLATGEWAPYASENLPGQGATTSLVRKVVREMGYEAEVGFYPWRRCYEMVCGGKVWAAFPYSWTEGRAEEVFFSDPVGFSDTVFYYTGTPPIDRYETIEDLKGLRIGAIDGYFYKEAFDQAGLDAEYVPDELSAFKMLLAERVDLVPVNLLVGQSIIDEHLAEYKTRFKVLDGLYSRRELRLIVSKRYPDSQELLERFNEALGRITQVSPETETGAGE